jgi:hypothetical protein
MPKYSQPSGKGSRELRAWSVEFLNALLSANRCTLNASILGLHQAMVRDISFLGCKCIISQANNVNNA